jgi:hypothetical protein
VLERGNRTLGQHSGALAGCAPGLCMSNIRFTAVEGDCGFGHHTTKLETSGSVLRGGWLPVVQRDFIRGIPRSAEGVPS